MKWFNVNFSSIKFEKIALSILKDGIMTLYPAMIRSKDAWLGVETQNWITHLSLASLLWDIGKQHSPRCDAAEGLLGRISSKKEIKIKNHSKK